MAGKKRTGRERAVAALADRQHGVVAQAQLRRIGWSTSAIGREVELGRLHPVFRGVYAVGHRRISRNGRLIAAVLACGPGTVVSHRSAAALIGLLDRGPVVIDVIAPGGRGRKLDGIKAHRSPPPSQSERTFVAGIPCTSPARTLADLASAVGEPTLRNAFEVAAFKRLLDLNAIEAVLAQGRRVGAPALRKIVAEWRSAAKRHPAQPNLRSPLEAKLLPLLATTDLPTPLVNHRVPTPGGDLEVDLLWPDHRFVVEADSRRHHDTDLAYERDRWRDRELLRAGYTTLRVPWQQAESEAPAVLDAIRQELTRRQP